MRSCRARLHPDLLLRHIPRQKHLTLGRRAASSKGNSAMETARGALESKGPWLVTASKLSILSGYFMPDVLYLRSCLAMGAVFGGLK